MNDEEIIFRRSISNTITSFTRMNKVKKLDGRAWKNNLTPILKNYVTKLINSL
jgi:hypothetical protein